MEQISIKEKEIIKNASNKVYNKNLEDLFIAYLVSKNKGKLLIEEYFRFLKVGISLGFDRQDINDGKISFEQFNDRLIQFANEDKNR